MSNKYKYKAYISYSHRDERWATWLHRALEAYRVPRKLVGTKTAVGKVPARVKPVFRDRDDLSSASDLGGTVKQALADSENMIVVCSPEAAGSFWVNEEIRQFASLGRVEKIFCVIVDGDPAGKDASTICFPAALAEVGLQEPLAADIRKWADGRRLSRLKLVAGMLGLPLDQLRRRDLQKRQKLWALASVAGIAITAVLITAITAQIAAQQRRISGESLVTYKLNELRTMLNVNTDPEDLLPLKAWNQEVLQELVDSAGTSENALFNSAMALREEGQALYEKRSLTEALVNFRQSWALLAENYRRNRNDKTIFFELGQAEFYIGQSYLDLGDLDRAEESFITYAEITRRLIVSQPENAEWVLEMAYALTNLGSLENERDSYDPERNLQLIQSALEYNQIALVLDPQNEYYQSELGQSHAFLADAQLGICDLEGALQSRKTNVALDQEILVDDRDNLVKVRRLAWAFTGYTFVLQSMGRVDESIETLEKILQLMVPVLQQNPGDLANFLYQLTRKQQLAMLRVYRGDMQEGARVMEMLNEEWQTLFQDGVADNIRVNRGYAAYIIDLAWIAKAKGDSDTALLLLDEGIKRTIEVLRELPDNRTAENLLILAVFRQWEMSGELPGMEAMMLVPEFWRDSGRTRTCMDASLAARKAIMLGDSERAVELSTYLMGKGYSEVEFIRACKAHSYCSGR